MDNVEESPRKRRRIESAVSVSAVATREDITKRLPGALKAKVAAMLHRSVFL